TKSLESAQYLYDQLAQIAADRRTLVCAVGGGVIGDLAGFVAATYLRGLPFYQVPTTLLAQVDSSVGGKVAVNHARGKNLIGCFYQPVGVLIDTDVLQSLPDRQYRCGLAEVVKYGVILDAQFFEFMEDRVDSINARNATVLRTLITRCCELKALVVEQDEREQGGQRAVLNFGHTFAHAFENLGNYQLLHGEAVAVGMVCASRLAVLLGRVEKKFTDRLFTLLNRLNLPTRLTQIDNHEGKGLADGETRAESHSMFDPDQVVQSMRYDKKAISGTPQFVLPSSLGKVELVQQVDPDLVRRSLIESSLG
ncbi:MAG: 3-dehydroquinate synthase, partial [Planctomycetes bacterium]|nr:3-dehydroquinate synthase [Planctomycetota bacterium]